VQNLAVRGHVIVTLDDGRVLLLREVVGGSVHYVAPGVVAEAGETPGQTARRAAQVHLGFDVEIADLVFADTEMGAEHFYFVGSPLTALDDEPVGPADANGDVSVVALKRTALLGYPVRPAGIGRRLHTPPARAG
jgi:ADP-ribose pyrophosphatase YjhB (NUDIX family)